MEGYLHFKIDWASLIAGSNAPINVNPVGGSAGKGRGFDA